MVALLGHDWPDRVVDRRCIPRDSSRACKSTGPIPSSRCSTNYVEDHQLSWREVWLIKSLAGKLPERDANLLFVDQQAYEQASQLVLEETSLNKRAKHQQRLNSLAQKLFSRCQVRRGHRQAFLKIPVAYLLPAR